MIDEKRIKENLEMFSFPRLSGTENEKKAFNLAKKKVEELKLRHSVQEFSFSTFYARIYPKLAALLTFWILFVLYVNYLDFFWLVNLIIVFSIFIPLYFITRKPEKIRFGKKLTSQNLYVKIPANFDKNKVKTNFNKKLPDNINENHKNNIFLFSHLDSKCQRFPIHIRSKVFKFWLYSTLVTFFIIIPKNFIVGAFFPQYSLWFYIIGVIPLGINFISTILVILNTTTNESPGALDNASGISCVFELLNYYLAPETKLKHFNLWFVFTGAEECGTMGVRHFYNIIKDFDRRTSVTLNFDSIGKSITIFTSANEDYNYYNCYKNFFEKARKFKAIVYSKDPLIHTSRSDGYFLYNKGGFNGIGFGDFHSYKYMHTADDTVDKVNPIVLKNLCNLIIDFLKDIDNQS